MSEWVKSFPRRRNSARVAAGCILACSGCFNSVFAENPQDVTELGVDQLLNLQVFAASRFPQKLSEAPANVTVITAADIAAENKLEPIRALFAEFAASSAMVVERAAREQRGVRNEQDHREGDPEGRAHRGPEGHERGQRRQGERDGGHGAGTWGAGGAVTAAGGR